MHRTTRVAGSIMALIGAGIASAVAAPPQPQIAEAQLRAINHRFVNAFLSEDSQFMDALTAEDFVLITSACDRLGREDHLELMRTPSGLKGASPIGTSKFACSMR